MQDTRTKIKDIENSKLKLMLHKIQSFSHSSIPQLKVLILLLALPCLALQCNKDDEDKNKPKDVTRLSEEFKSYAYFKEGSWWVYKELNSGYLDSAYIIRSDILVEYRSERHGGPEDYEHLSYDLVKKIYEDSKDTVTLRGFPAAPPNNEDGQYRGKRIFALIRVIYKYGISGNTLLTTPVDTNYKVNENGVYIKKTLDSLTIVTRK